MTQSPSWPLPAGRRSGSERPSPANGPAAASGQSPENGCSAGDELIFRSERTRVVRRSSPDRPARIICKEPLGPDALARARNETRILERLADVEGVPRVLAGSSSSAVIAVDDVGGLPLSDALRAQPLPLPALIDLAWGLSLIVADVHRHGVVHKDINPTNILLARGDGGPVLIDFDLATTFAEERPAFVHHREIAGCLPYLAPEQTGRTGRPVDYRADLYALGATLYELATGRPPFGEGDPLQLIRDQLSRMPTPPADADPRLPRGLSDIIMRLLDKEPERRYQSAEGLAYDLSRLKERLGRGDTGPFALGQRDFPLRLSPPSRLFGRDAEIAALRQAFSAAIEGRSRGILVAGAPGIGKTALIDELRPMVTAQGGWFLAGKFDQYRHGAATGAVVQAMRGLGRMLLAEPEPVVAEERDRILRALGPNAGLVAAALPEFAILLGDAPGAASADPVGAEAQLRLAALALLRTIASARRPLVIVLDDLQWAPAGSFRFIDAVLADQTLSGLLVVGAYREADVDAMHPLLTLQPKWARLGVAPPLLRLRSLEPAAVGGMLEDMLRLSVREATRLREVLGERTGGNPLETIELVNALRRDGVLVPGPWGWSWNDAAIRRYVGRGDVVELVASRLARLPAGARKLLRIMACLGGQVEVELLRAASGLSPAEFDARLTPSLEDGLVVIERGSDRPASPGGVRFRHDRVQQAAYDGLRPHRRRAMHLAVARRLARDGDLAGKAAEQYLAAIDAVDDRGEQQRVVVLFRQAAETARRVANHTAVERYLAAATRLMDAAEVPPEDPDRAAMAAARHVALYSIGRHAEADSLYAAIARTITDPRALAEAACVQMNSLCSRGAFDDAVRLGVGLLRRLGVDIPDDIEAGIRSRMRGFYRLCAEQQGERECERPDTRDSRVAAIGRISAHLTFAAFYADHAACAWVLLENHRLWVEHGPCAALLYQLAVAPFVTISWGDDFRTGYAIARRAMTTGEARRYESEMARAQCGFGLFSSHWCEPLENSVEHARRAREGLLRAGDLQYAGLTYSLMFVVLLDCAETLDAYAGEVEAAPAFAARTGNERAVHSFLPYRQLLRALRGETEAPGSLSDAAFVEADYLASLRGNPTALNAHHTLAAIAAAVFGDTARLIRHCAEAMRLKDHMIGLYRTALVQMLQAVALSERCRRVDAGERSALLAELDACRDWLARRAADAPMNFLHLVRLVEAERAWAAGDHWGAASGFEAAVDESERHQRPWHRALIAERAGLFHLANGLRHAGREFLAKARQAYEAWGATGKVRQLDEAHPFLRDRRPGAPVTARARSGSVSSDAIDLLAVLRTSQALSSETSLDRLQARIVELLGAMTGATRVLVALWRHEPAGWYLAGDDADAIGVDEAAARGMLPIAALRYVERTRLPLLVEDATRDGRFSADPYFARLECASLLVVPILSHGAPRAMLVLENRLSRGAFSTDRLEIVTLIAGQLAVSFDNALLYASLESKVAERTRALEEANRSLATLSITDPLTGLANRRKFAEVLEAEWQRAQRPGCSIGMALIDIDHFKQYNDRYGHIAGDACLRRVAAALEGSIRQGTDLLVRYGGEEFAIILPGADLDATHGVVERARRVVSALEEPHAGAPRGFVTISVGIAAISPAAHDSAEQLIQAADAALYEAKRSGRNQVRCAPAVAAATPASA